MKTFSTDLWDRAAFGPLLAIPAFLGTLGTAAGTAGAAAGAAASGGSLLGGLGTAAAALGGIGTLAMALKGAPKPPTVPPTPTMPQFSGGLQGGSNASLAAQSPFFAQGGTNRGSFALPSSGGKTLLGQ